MGVGVANPSWARVSRKLLSRGREEKLRAGCSGMR
jgi:hypothetical protein